MESNMHEMSIAMNIVEIAGAEAARNGVEEVRAIHAEIGTLAGVEIESLRFCFEAARAETVAAHAELRIEVIEGRGRCAACGREMQLVFPLGACPLCAAPGLEIVAGRELRVSSLLVE
jgi:hydrogenase nickel incorporation protein HypA/HybF